MSKTKIVLGFLLWVFRASCNEPVIGYGRSYIHGHNLISTTYTLPKRTLTVGTYIVGYGLSDEVFIATSPWLDILYNMPTIEVKYGANLSERWRWSEEVLYFKTAPYLSKTYQMEAVMNRLGASYHFNQSSTLHAQFVYFYYFDDTKPFSLRLSSDNDHRYQLAAGFLLETHVSPSWGTMIEVASLGLNYKNVYLHAGFSFFYKFSNGYLQLGLSDSVTTRTVQWVSPTFTSPHYEEQESIYHPEVALQFHF